MLPYINAPFEYAANILGASVDEFKLIALFLFSYPLAALLKRLPDGKPWLKNVFSISVSVFYLVGFFDLWSGLLLIVFDATVTYLIAAYVRNAYMPWIGFVFLMGHMSVSHIQRQVANAPETVDISAAQMVMVMKLCAFCWHVFDGRQKPSELTDLQRDRALAELPDLLDYAGFVMFFPSLMPGPSFDFADYRRWIETSMFDLPPGTDPTKAPPTRKKRRIPRSGTPAMVNLVTGLLWILAFLQLSGYYNAQTFLSKDFEKHGFLRRVLDMYMLGLTQRTKYYGVWTLSEGACILAGIGYNGVDPKTGKPKWNRLTNINPMGVELAQSTHGYLSNWNINTNDWLRNCVYLRVTPKGKKPGFRATLATFVTSAFWHGFYPGYYFSFVLASFIQNIGKNSRRLIRPFFMSPDGTKPTPYKIYYDIFTLVATQLAFSFSFTPFVLLSLSKTLLAWQRVYYFGVIATAIPALALLTPVKPWLQKKIKARQSKSELKRVDSRDFPDATLGIPDDPGKEWDAMLDEVVGEVKKRRGSLANVDAKDLKRAVDESLSTLLKKKN